MRPPWTRSTLLMSFSGVAKASPQLSCFLFPSIVNVLFQSIINILGIFYLVAPCCTHDIVSNCMSIQTSVLVFICLFVCFLLLLSVTVLHTMVVVVVCPSAREYKFAYLNTNLFAHLKTNLHFSIQIWIQICASPHKLAFLKTNLCISTQIWKQIRANLKTKQLSHSVRMKYAQNASQSCQSPNYYLSGISTKWRMMFSVEKRHQTIFRTKRQQRGNKEATQRQQRGKSAQTTSGANFSHLPGFGKASLKTILSPNYHIFAVTDDV